MPDTKKSVRDEPWFKNVPEYMGEAIVLITETRDEARMILARLLEREQVLGDREGALIAAIKDMKDFANQLYGPESELSKINAKLDAIDRAIAKRDTEHSQQIQKISGEQATFMEWCKGQVEGLRTRVSELERKTA